MKECAAPGGVPKGTMATRLHQPSPSCAAPAQRNGGWGLAGLPARAASELAVSPRPTAQASVSFASGHRYPRIARAKAATPGEKRRPVIDTSETWRTTSGVGNEASEDAGDNRPKLRDKTDAEPAATIIWIQSSRSLRKPTWTANPSSRQRSFKWS